MKMTVVSATTLHLFDLLGSGHWFGKGDLQSENGGFGRLPHGIEGFEVNSLGISGEGI